MAKEKSDKKKKEEVAQDVEMEEAVAVTVRLTLSFTSVWSTNGVGVAEKVQEGEEGERRG